MKVLHKALGNIGFSIDSNNIIAISNTNITELAKTPTFGIYVQKDYFDLAGLTQQEKTLFFETVSVQDAFNPAISGGHTGDGFLETIILTTTPIPDSRLQAEIVFGVGLPGSEVDWSQVVYFRNRTFVQTADIAGFAFLPTNSESRMGSAYPTASDRVYIYRFVHASCVASDAHFTSLAVSGCQIVLGASAVEEPDFQYLYRLMRSYELQQSHDED